MVQHIAGAAFALLAAFGVGRIVAGKAGASFAATMVLGMSALSAALAVVFLTGIVSPAVVAALACAGLVFAKDSSRNNLSILRNRSLTVAARNTHSEPRP